MDIRPLSTRHYPRAIVHLDADAFFASVEQSLEPSLRNRPVVTGRERGIIACANYMAKERGIKRGIPLFEAKRKCPELVILPNDYETYSVFSKRMFEIMRHYTPLVEEYSIDEAFADITGMRKFHHGSYEDIARRMQADIHHQLGITVSVGVSCTKAIAKLCSKFRKPNGITAVPAKVLHHLLVRTALEDVWGFGPNTVALLEKYGLHTAYDYTQRQERWVKRMLHKPGHELWHELRGDSVWPVTPEPKVSYASILKSKTFTPPSPDPELVFAKLMRNVEAAFAKVRRYRLRPTVLAVILRYHDYRHEGLEAKLSRPTSATQEIIPLIRRLFDEVFRSGTAYRSTMIVLGQCEPDASDQYELFESPVCIDRLRRLSVTVDDINARYGRTTMSSGTALFLARKPVVARDAAPERHNHRLPGETTARRLSIPRLNIQV